jgi:hypothetical protein
MCINEIAHIVFKAVMGAILGLALTAMVILGFLFVFGSILMANIR